MRKPYSLQYSYQQGETAFTRTELKAEAKRQGVEYRVVHTPYVGHKAFEIKGALTKMKKFLTVIGMASSISLIEKPEGGWLGSK